MPPEPPPSVPTQEADLFQLLVDSAQIAGAGLSLIALVVAFVALYRGRRDLAIERRNTFDLETLRRMYELRRNLPDREFVVHIYTYLMLLPGSDDFPLTRAAIGARPTAAQNVEYNVRYPGVRSIEAGGFLDARFRKLEDDGTHIAEFEAAVERRMNPRGRATTRRYPWKAVSARFRRR